MTGTPISITRRTLCVGFQGLGPKMLTEIILHHNVEKTAYASLQVFSQFNINEMVQEQVENLDKSLQYMLNFKSLC